jgi:hypothetical protein
MKPHLWLIKFIGVFVPERLRADWRQEWEAELRYREELLAEWDDLNWKTKLDLLWRSLGAFRDALLLQPRRLEEEMFQDLRFGVRMLLKRPGFTLVAALTLALGIGATTALFSVVYAVLISPYPYAKPEGIWTPGLRTAQSNQRMRPYRLNEYLEMAKLPVFADVMATAPGRALLTGEYAPEARSISSACRLCWAARFSLRIFAPTAIRSRSRCSAFAGGKFSSEAIPTRSARRCG